MRATPLPQRFTPAPLALAATIALALAAGLAPPAHAQGGAAAATATPIAIDIPAQPLAQALNELARQANLQMTFSPALVVGKRAPAVRGNLTARQALDRLLRDSGLGARVAGTSVVVAAQPPERQLPEVRVRDQADLYRPLRASGATRTEEPLIDIPVSITVLTEQLIVDQFAQTQDELLRNVPSVGRAANQGNVAGSQNTTIRGFNTRSVFKDGVRFFQIGEVYLDNIESVEIIKGPASMLFGRIEPGGLINYVRKKPQRSPLYSLSLTVGSDSYRKVALDFTGPLGSQGDLQYRLIASYLKSGSFIDHNERESHFISPSFRYETDRLVVDVGYEQGKLADTFDPRLPVFGRTPDTSIPRSRFLGHPDNIRYTRDQAAWLRAVGRLSDVTSITGALTWSKFTHESYSYRAATHNAALRTFTALGSLRPPTSYPEYGIDLFVTHSHALGNWRNTLVAGLDWRRRQAESVPCNGNLNNAYTSSIDNPDYSQPSPRNFHCGTPGFVFFNVSTTKQDQAGIFAQNTSWITNYLQLLLGLRYTEIDLQTRNFTRNTVIEQRDSAITGRAGLLYKITPALSLYASYADSFDQLVGRRADGAAFQPTEGRQFELGFKREVGTSGGALLTGSLYTITQRNLTVPDPLNPGFSVQEGKVRSNGAELQLAGEILPRLSLVGGIGYIDNEVVGGPNDGRRLPNVYRLKASAWANYRLSDAWTLGGGVFHHGNSYINPRNTNEIPAATIFDAAATWTTRAWGGRTTLQFNVKNIFDSEHFTGGFGAGNSAWTYAEPGRQFFVRLTREF